MTSGDVLMVTEDAFYQLKSEVTSSTKELFRLSRILDGNGREGLVQTTMRIETRLDNMGEHFDELERLLKSNADLIERFLDKPPEKQSAGFKEMWEGYSNGIKIGIILGAVLASAMGLHSALDLLKILFGF